MSSESIVHIKNEELRKRKEKLKDMFHAITEKNVRMQLQIIQKTFLK